MPHCMSFQLAPCEDLLLSGLAGSERLSAKTRIENLSYKRDSGHAIMTAISHKCGFSYEFLSKFYDLRNKSLRLIYT